MKILTSLYFINFGTIAHHVFGVSGCGHYQCTLSGRIYLLCATEAAPALQFTRDRIYQTMS